MLRGLNRFFGNNQPQQPAVNLAPAVIEQPQIIKGSLFGDIRINTEFLMMLQGVNRLLFGIDIATWKTDNQQYQVHQNTTADSRLLPNCFFKNTQLLFLAATDMEQLSSLYTNVKNNADEFDRDFHYIVLVNNDTTEINEQAAAMQLTTFNYQTQTKEQLEELIDNLITKKLSTSLTLESTVKAAEFKM